MEVSAAQKIGDNNYEMTLLKGAKTELAIEILDRWGKTCRSGFQLMKKIS